ncbi:cold shock domain-containing protein 4-like [Nymphaea colorata]|uniref:Glycine-rich protein n=1 Tax=Nymphaea colorata TaxID=210225 RepID=A0A5K0XLC0_9MAGN|nr:cold shock domain-containing protein 4-like [Nymphaea colorata]
MKTTGSSLSRLAALLLVLAAAAASQETAWGFEEELRKGSQYQNPNPNMAGIDPFAGIPGGFGPGGGFSIPGWGSGIIGGGYGGGFGGPKGGYSKNGVYRSAVTCNVPGPCYRKKLVCPKSCFGSYSRSGKGYGEGGGGGGCIMDCKKKCIAYC